MLDNKVFDSFNLTQLLEETVEKSFELTNFGVRSRDGRILKLMEAAKVKDIIMNDNKFEYISLIQLIFCNL